MTCSNTVLGSNKARGDESSATRDDEDFVEFVRTNTPVLLRSAYLLTGSGPAAEELVQDTLVRLYPQWERVRSADVPLAYVRRALTNRFLNLWRGSARREVLVDALPDRGDGGRGETELADRDEMWALLQTLSGRQRTALVLRYYEGLNDREIAAILGARPGTVRSLISRGLASLRTTTQSPQPTNRPDQRVTERS